ncbi:MAG: AAA family ATPase [Candidatus Heimdallarchaeota archaeon]|nr:AAA family ATPase [Candidatus Heimdallarchaeota archaeon]
MTYTIAVAGKGGTGKTTFAGLLINALAKENRSLLAVDADPNANLNEVLGVAVAKSIADIREDTLKNDSKYNSMPKDRLIEYLLHQTLTETETFDLLAMGRPEGKRCYCFVNNLLRRHLDVLNEQYHYIIIDNEAGMEHLSRMTTRDVDLLIVISDPSYRGLLTAKRIQNLVNELNIPVKHQLLAINKLRKENNQNIMNNAMDLGFKSVLALPQDDYVISYDEEGQQLTNLPLDSPLRIAVEGFAKQLQMMKCNCFNEKEQAISITR